MALAQPKERTKLSLDPNNLHWSQDTNRYGHKMMEKMGWTNGMGLGKNKNGKTENVKVRQKNNSLGIGAAEKKDNQWLLMQNAFNDLLGNLAQCHTEGIDQRQTAATSQRDDLVSASRNMFYNRFVRSKDTSKYSETDLACIVGSTPTTPATASPMADSDTDSPCGKTSTSTMNISDYFALKMAARKAGQASDSTEAAAQGVMESTSEAPQTAAAVEELATERKSRKRNQKDGSSSENMVSAADGNGKKQRKKKRKTTSGTSNGSAPLDTAQAEGRQASANGTPVDTSLTDEETCDKTMRGRGVSEKRRKKAKQDKEGRTAGKDKPREEKKKKSARKAKEGVDK